MNSLRLIVALGAISGLVGVSSANFLVTGRASDAHWDYLFGYGPDGYTDADTTSAGSLLTSDSLSLTGIRHGQGEYLGHAWEVDLNWEAGHSYSVAGGLGSATAISSQGRAFTDSYTGGATSTVTATTGLTIDFTVTSATDFVLNAELLRVGPINRNNATLYVQGDFGVGYQTIMVWESNTTINQVGTFVPANYRVILSAGSKADGDETTEASWNFNLQSVPEPSSAIVLLPALAALGRRRRKS